MKNSQLHKFVLMLTLARSTCESVVKASSQGAPNSNLVSTLFARHAKNRLPHHVLQNNSELRTPLLAPEGFQSSINGCVFLPLAFQPTL